MYSPIIGGFLQRDPIGYAGSMNAYQYALNNSIINSDPYGLYSGYEFLRDTSNFSAGFGDAVTFGGTNWIRNQLGYNDVINRCSGFYKAGEVSGIGAQFALGAAASLNAGFKTVLYSGGESALNAARAGKGSGVLIENTFGGRLLNTLNSGIKSLGGKGLPQGVWDLASGIFAANAKGTVRVFLSEGSYSGTFYRIEAPIIEFFKNASIVFY